MSYCRCGGDSDVYCYGTGSGWEVIVAKDANISHALRYTNYETRKAACGFLLQLRDMGIRVPQSAIDRFEKEINEE